MLSKLVNKTMCSLSIRLLKVLEKVAGSLGCVELAAIYRDPEFHRAIVDYYNRARLPITPQRIVNLLALRRELSTKTKVISYRVVDQYTLARNYQWKGRWTNVDN